RRWRFVAGALLATFSHVFAGDPSIAHVEHPFRHFAEWLREVDPDLRNAESNALSRAITVLSKSQKTIKSFDGMAHELGGRIGGADVSTANIERLKAEAAAARDAEKAKVARRLLWKLVNVELALNAAEAAEAAAQPDPIAADAFFAEAGLSPLPMPAVPAPSPAATAAGPDAAVAEPDASQIGARAGAAGDGAAAVATGAAGNTAGPVAAFTQAEGAAALSPAEQLPPQPLVQSVVVPIPGGAGDGDYGDGAEVRCHVRLDAAGRRVVLAVGDSLAGAALVRTLAAPPAELRLASHGLMRETVYANAAAYGAAMAVLKAVGGAIADFLASPAGAGYSVFCVGHSFGGAVAVLLAGVLDGILNGDNAATSAGLGATKGDKTAAVSASKKEGGDSAVAADVAVVAGAAAAATNTAATAAAAAAAAAVVASDWRRCIGAARGRVAGVSLGCPPCLSRNLALPFVTAFILGDDVVPRLSEASLKRLRERLASVLPRGRGLLARSVAIGAGLLSDAAGVAVQGVRHYSTAAEDDVALAVPGRVWFVKPRRLHRGATMSRVMRGNLREDVLWQVKDVLLSKSMLSHHRLDYYVKILDRV
ncbi:unnamed protein product, partial [Phaeothamnion confervicola]